MYDSARLFIVGLEIMGFMNRFDIFIEDLDFIIYCNSYQHTKFPRLIFIAALT